MQDVGGKDSIESVDVMHEIGAREPYTLVGALRPHSGTIRCVHISAKKIQAMDTKLLASHVTGVRNCYVLPLL